MTWLLIALGVGAVAGLVLLWSLLALGGDLSQREEDRHGVDKARRS